MTALRALIDAVDRQPERPTYGIRLSSGLYAGHNRKWTDSPEHVIRFGSALRATLAAIELLELSPCDFTVEILS